MSQLPKFDLDGIISLISSDAVMETENTAQEAKCEVVVLSSSSMSDSDLEITKGKPTAWQTQANPDVKAGVSRQKRKTKKLTGIAALDHSTDSSDNEFSMFASRVARSQYQSTVTTNSYKASFEEYECQAVEDFVVPDSPTFCAKTTGEQSKKHKEQTQNNSENKIVAKSLYQQLLESSSSSPPPLPASRTVTKTTNDKLGKTMMSESTSHINAKPSHIHSRIHNALIDNTHSDDKDSESDDTISKQSATKPPKSQKPKKQIALGTAPAYKSISKSLKSRKDPITNFSPGAHTKDSHVMDQTRSHANDIIDITLPSTPDRHQRKRKSSSPAPNNGVTGVREVKKSVKGKEKASGVSSKSSSAENLFVPITIGDYDNDHEYYNEYDSEPDSKTNNTRTKSTTKLSKEEREKQKQQKQLEKIRKAAEKALAVQQRKEEREAKKAQKVAEKEYSAALRKANKVLTKDEAVLELIPILDRRFFEEDDNNDASGFGNDVKSAIEELGCSVRSCEQVVPWTITWIRRLNKRWNEEQEMFEPLPNGKFEELEEPRVMVVVKATTFANYVKIGMTSPGGVKDHLQAIRNGFPNKNVVYFVQGLESYYRTRRAKANKEVEPGIRQAVVSGLVELGYNFASSQAGSTKKPRKQKEGAQASTEGWRDMPDKHAMEQALVWMQVFEGVNVQTSETNEETKNWIKGFTRELGMRLYYEKQSPMMAFCDVNIKAGTDAQDTYRKMLSQVNMVSDAHVASIVAAYPSLRLLYEAFKRDGERAIEDLMMRRNNTTATATGATRRIGPAVSKRLHALFTSMDPEEQVMQ